MFGGILGIWAASGPLGGGLTPRVGENSIGVAGGTSQAQGLQAYGRQALIEEATGNKSLVLEKAEVETRFSLELEAFYALPDSDKKGVTIRVAKNM